MVLFCAIQSRRRSRAATLRVDVFQRGEYYNDVVDMLAHHRDGDYDPLTSPPRYRFSGDDLKRWLSSSQPETIEDLIKIQGDTGTHSILDIDGIADMPTERMIAPLSEAELVSLFGTNRLTRTEIARADQMTLYTMRQRWEGVYVIVYLRDVPSEIFFYGYSGD